MFSRRLFLVVNMDLVYMVKYDGSEQVVGCGFGCDVKLGRFEKNVVCNIGNVEGMIFYMQMIFVF